MIADSEIISRTHSNGYIKGDKYFFFIKVCVANDLLKIKLIIK